MYPKCAKLNDASRSLMLARIGKDLPPSAIKSKCCEEGEGQSHLWPRDEGTFRWAGW